MSEIKPVFYVDPCTLRCRTMDDISDESTIYYRRGDKVAEKDVALYSEDAIEALQKENAELIKDRQHYANRADLSEKSVAVLQAMNAAQAKRIAELEAAVKANHEWHQEHDDYDGYQESALYTTNTSTLSVSKNGE